MDIVQFPKAEEKVKAWMALAEVQATISKSDSALKLHVEGLEFSLMPDPLNRIIVDRMNQIAEELADFGVTVPMHKVG